MMEEEPKRMVLAHIKRKEDPNVILFATDPKQQEIVQLFANQFSECEAIEYDNEHELAEDECWVADLSDTQFDAVASRYVLNLNSTADLNHSKVKATDDNIRAIYLVEDNAATFKRIYKNQYLQDSSILSMDGEPKITDIHNVLAINDRIDAIIDIEAKRLTFKNYNAAKLLFPELIDFYRSATQEEVDQWFDTPMFELDQNFSKHMVGATNRKKIAFALKELEIALTDATTAEKVKEHAVQNAPAALFENGTFKLASNKDISEMLKIVTGAYYKNPITDDRMLAKTSAKVTVEGE